MVIERMLIHRIVMRYGNNSVQCREKVTRIMLEEASDAARAVWRSENFSDEAVVVAVRGNDGDEFRMAR